MEPSLLIIPSHVDVKKCTDMHWLIIWMACLDIPGLHCFLVPTTANIAFRHISSLGALPKMCHPEGSSTPLLDPLTYNFRFIPALGKAHYATLRRYERAANFLGHGTAVSMKLLKWGALDARHVLLRFAALVPSFSKTPSITICQ
jgi:hypothetical protein